VKGSLLESRPGFLVCPLCEVHELDARGHGSPRCNSCGGIVSGLTLKVLQQITDLPDALGSHACECGYPEMRRLPDGTRHCPSCGSEVMPVDAQALLSEHGEAWRAGWADGSFRELSSFVDNPNLAKWEAPSDRLAYYRGHRAGSETRRDRGGRLLARARKVEP
jgi:ribosomal protein L37AE/L43A